MNGYPYPVLTEVDSAYKADVNFNVEFSKYACKEDKIVLGEDTFSCWEVYNCSSSELVMFDIGDVVIATGTIRDAFVGQVELVEKTTIEHYNG